MRKPQKKNERLGQFSDLKQERHLPDALEEDKPHFPHDDCQVTLLHRLVGRPHAPEWECIPRRPYTCRNTFL
jgi:hypothetical protein